MAIPVENTLYPVKDEKPSVVEENKIGGGYFIIARKIDQSEIAHAAPHVREIWHWLIKEANHKPYKTSGKTIDRGQLLTTFHDIQEALYWSEGFVKRSYKKHHVDNALRWLRQHLMITTHKTTRGLIVTVCNYAFYQNPKNYEYDNGYDTVTTPLRQRKDRINKNTKNNKNERSIKDAATEFFKKEIESNLSDKLIDQYRGMAYHLLGKNPEKKIYENVLQMDNLPTLAEFKSMERVSVETGEKSNEILDEMENYKPLRKNNTSVSATCMNWMRRNYKKKNKE